MTFSSSCTQATTVYNASENCWITTLPANCNPGQRVPQRPAVPDPVGLQPVGRDALPGPSAQSANNCGSSNVSWQTGCQGYNSFNVNGCNGLTNYNQIGVQVCDNLSGCGNGGNCGSSSACAGTPVNQCTSGNCGCGQFRHRHVRQWRRLGHDHLRRRDHQHRDGDRQPERDGYVHRQHVGDADPGCVDREVGDLGRRRLGRSDGDLCRRGDRLQLVVTNTGNETLTNVVVNDTTLGTTLGTLASLAVGRHGDLHRVADGHPGRAQQHGTGDQHRDGDRHAEHDGARPPPARP